MTSEDLEESEKISLKTEKIICRDQAASFPASELFCKPLLLIAPCGCGWYYGFIISTSAPP